MVSARKPRGDSATHQHDAYLFHDGHAFWCSNTFGDDKLPQSSTLGEGRGHAGPCPM